MQEAIPYRTSWLVKTSTEIGSIKAINGGGGRGEMLRRLVNENAVIVFAKTGCCMSYVVKCLLQRLGANPAVYELLDDDDHLVVSELQRVTASGGSGSLQFPAVFIGGRWFGGLDRIIATHITDELTPLLKEAGALWL